MPSSDAISPACGVITARPSSERTSDSSSRSASIAAASRTRIASSPSARDDTAHQRARRASRVMPGPTSSAFTSRTVSRSARRHAPAISPLRAAASATTSASGTAMPSAIAALATVASCSFPAPARSAATPASRIAPGTSAATDGEDGAARVLVTLAIDARQRMLPQPRTRDLGSARRRTPHFAPAGLSGFDVTGAPASSSGATKL